jgi:hypothetical protein
MLDRTYIKHIKNSKLLNDSSKKIYLARLEVIQNNIWKNCKSINHKVGKGKCLYYIIKHPDAFIEKMDEYVNKTGGRLDKNKLSMHAKDGYVSAIGAIFRHTPGMIQKQSELYKRWLDIHQEVRTPINAKYQSNEPNSRQKEAYISFEELVKIRNKLEDGTIDKLLLSMYTMIPSVRNDYYKTAIYKNENMVTDDVDNYLIMNNKPYIVLRKYKTSKTYKTIKIDLPKELVEQIKLSLDKNPRKFLFVSPRNNKEYKSNTFNRWVNRTLKSLTGKENISINTLRHIYVTRRDLKLEEKSGLERNKIAKVMGHSVGTQQNYLWHTYEKERKNNKYDEDL